MIDYDDDDLLGMPPMPPIGPGKPLSPEDRAAIYAELDAACARQERSEATVAHRKAVLAADPTSDEAVAILAERAANRIYKARYKAEKRAAQVIAAAAAPVA